MKTHLDGTNIFSAKFLQKLYFSIAITIVGLIILFGPISSFNEYPEPEGLTLVQGELVSLDEAGPELVLKLKGYEEGFFFAAKLKKTAYSQLKAGNLQNQQVKLKINKKQFDSIDSKGQRFYKIFELSAGEETIISYQAIKAADIEVAKKVMYLSYILIVAGLFIAYKKLKESKRVNVCT